MCPARKRTHYAFGKTLHYAFGKTLHYAPAVFDNRAKRCVRLTPDKDDDEAGRKIDRKECLLSVDN